MAPPEADMSEDELEGYEDHESGDENEDEDPWGPGGGGIEDVIFRGQDRNAHRSSDELETLCQELLGAPVKDAEPEVRTFLNRTQGEAREADVLAILLMLFRLCRDAAIEEYEPWDLTLGYCSRVTAICDENFVGNYSEDNRQTGCLSAAIVGTVYAEVGRTFALAGQPGVARDRLMKALHAFDLSSESQDDSAKQHHAAARASLARVLRGVGRAGEALPEFMQALQLYITLDSAEDLSGIISEWCETVVAAGPEHLTENVPALLCDLAEGAFGDGSPLHLKALNDVTNACTNVGSAWIAAGAATLLARHLKEGGRIEGKKPVPFALREAEIEAVEEAAASAWEEAVQKRLADGDIAAAADAWSEALWLRESLASSSPELLEAMRASLEALRLAADASTSAGPEEDEHEHEQEQEHDYDKEHDADQPDDEHHDSRNNNNTSTNNNNSSNNNNNNNNNTNGGGNALAALAAAVLAGEADEGAGGGEEGQEDVADCWEDLDDHGDDARAPPARDDRGGDPGSDDDDATDAW